MKAIINGLINKIKFQGKGGKKGKKELTERFENQKKERQNINEKEDVKKKKDDKELFKWDKIG